MSQTGLYLSFGSSVATSFDADAGTAIPALGVLTIAGGTNIGTTGAGSTITINLDDDVTLAGFLDAATTVTAGTGLEVTTGDADIVAGNITLPVTNGAGSEGIIQFGGNNWVSNYGTNNTFVGASSGNTTLNVGSAVNNTAIGNIVLQSITTGSRNTGAGNGALNALTEAKRCCAFGQSAAGGVTTANYTTAIGAFSLQNVVTGVQNTALGYSAGISLGATDSSNICVGHDGVNGDNNTLRLGTQGAGVGQIDTAYIAGIYNSAIGATAGVVHIDDTGLLGSSNGANGELLIGGGTGPVWTNLTSTGGTIDITNGANSINLEISGGVEWTEVTGAAQAMAVNHGYIANNGARVWLTLPAAAAIGDVIEVVGKGAGGWRIMQNAGQTMHFISTSTAVGVGGYLESTQQYDGLSLVCITANTDFLVKSSVGNITVT